MLEVSVRTMEFCRQLGIADKVRNWGFPPDWPLDSAFVTDMQGYELGRVRTPALGVRAGLRVQPGARAAVPADLVRSDPAGLRAVVSARDDPAQHQARRLRAGCKPASPRRCATGRAAAAKPCARPIWSAATASTSTVRELLGIAIRGEPHIDWSMTVYLRIPELHAAARQGKGLPLRVRRAGRHLVVPLDRRRQGSVAAAARRYRRGRAAERRHPGADAALHGPRRRLHHRGQGPVGAKAHGRRPLHATAACSSPAMPPMPIRRTAGSA